MGLACLSGGAPNNWHSWSIDERLAVVFHNTRAQDVAHRACTTITENVMRISKNGLVLASVTMAHGLLSLRPAWAHTDHWLPHAHPHGIETVIGLGIAVALVVIAFIGLSRRRDK